MEVESKTVQTRVSGKKKTIPAPSATAPSAPPQPSPPPPSLPPSSPPLPVPSPPPPPAAAAPSSFKPWTAARETNPDPDEAYECVGNFKLETPALPKPKSKTLVPATPATPAPFKPWSPGDTGKVPGMSQFDANPPTKEHSDSFYHENVGAPRNFN